MQKIVPFLFILFFSIGYKSISQEKILFVVSNQQTYGDSTIKTSNHFGEIVYAYDVLLKAGFKVDFVSPKGGTISFGYINKSNSIQKKYLGDTNLLNKLKNTLDPKKVIASNYRALYYVGGGAAMFGVPENKEIQQIALYIYEKNKGIVAAICHGTAGIINLKTSNGDYLYKGKQISGYPDIFENTKAEYYQQFPFSIEKIIKKRGGIFSYDRKRNANYYKVDGRLITGQDPSASASVAKKIVEGLKQKNN
ncbi:MAG: type 1 glutamine amidotransferase domain-containing protein [Cellulophaga sp.]